jgi:hypothetical protein
MVIEGRSLVSQERITTILSINDTVCEPLLTQSIFSLCIQQHPPGQICIASYRQDQTELAVNMIRQNNLRETPLEVFHFEDSPNTVPARLHDVLAGCDSEYVAFLQQDEVLYHQAYDCLLTALTRTSKALAAGSFRLARINSLAAGVHIYAKETVPNPDSDFLLKSDWQNVPLAAFLLSRQTAESETFNIPLTPDWCQSLLRTCLMHQHPAYDLSSPVCEKRIVN